MIWLYFFLRMWLLTYQTSVSSLEWQPTYVVQPVGCPVPLCLHFTDRVTDYLSVCECVCCFRSVWLQGWSHVQEWSLPLPRWQAWPQQVNVHYHMKTKCQAAPPPTTAICLSLWVSLPGTLALQHKHAHLLLFEHAQIYSAGRKWHLLVQIQEVPQMEAK